MCFLNTHSSSPFLNITAAAPTFPSMHQLSKYTLISQVSFPNSSSARFLVSGIWVLCLGNHFGLVWIGQMSSNLLGLILYTCSSSCSGDLWLLTYFFATLFAWVASG